jgi:hypothetical protein
MTTGDAQHEGPEPDPLTEMCPDGVQLRDYQAYLAGMEAWLDPEPEAEPG